MRQVDESMAAFKELSALTEMRQESKNYCAMKIIPEHSLIDYEMKERKKVNLWHKAIVKNNEIINRN